MGRPYHLFLRKITAIILFLIPFVPHLYKGGILGGHNDGFENNRMNLFFSFSLSPDLFVQFNYFFIPFAPGR